MTIAACCSKYTELYPLTLCSVNTSLFSLFPFNQFSWHGNGCRRDLVTLFARAHRMPVCNRNSVGLKHARPMIHLVCTRTVFSKNDSTDKVVFALRVVVPDCNNKTCGVELLWGDIKTNRLVEDWIQGVFLKRCLLCFDWFLEMHQCHLHKRI